MWTEETETRNADESADGQPVAEKAADGGMATAEYAIATLAACGFAALLVVILRSDDVRQLLMGIIQHALALGS